MRLQAGSAPGWDPCPPLPPVLSGPRTGQQTHVLSAIPTLCHLSTLGWGLGSALEPQTDPRLDVSFAHREAERLLEAKPEGCYLVRFSESAVTFVLTYR